MFLQLSTAKENPTLPLGLRRKLSNRFRHDRRMIDSVWGGFISRATVCNRRRRRAAILPHQEAGSFALRATKYTSKMDQDNRRQFLKTTGAALAAGFPAIVRGQATNAIKVGLVGCGGRGTGAASQALKADDYAELTAVADISQLQVDNCLDQLTKINGAKVKVEPKNVFLGLNAYQQLIDSGVDLVILTTPPGFRPMHLRACIDAGKHVFCEKPIAVDSSVPVRMVFIGGLGRNPEPEQHQSGHEDVRRGLKSVGHQRHRVRRQSHRDFYRRQDHADGDAGHRGAPGCLFQTPHDSGYTASCREGC
jgi:hypothetical protein